MGCSGVVPHPETGVVSATDVTPISQQGRPAARDQPAAGKGGPAGIRVLYTNSLKAIRSTQAGPAYDRIECPA